MNTIAVLLQFVGMAMTLLLLVAVEADQNLELTTTPI